MCKWEKREISKFLFLIEEASLDKIALRKYPLILTNFYYVLFIYIYFCQFCQMNIYYISSSESLFVNFKLLCCQQSWINKSSHVNWVIRIMSRYWLASLCTNLQFNEWALATCVWPWNGKLYITSLIKTQRLINNCIRPQCVWTQ